ncbi:MAG: MFS transporter [Actinomycetota bacterium]|nr:MFS transporter [Actinomycetota bacterium]
MSSPADPQGRPALARDVGAVLREPSFVRLFLTRLSSQTADGIFQVALASFVFFSPEKQTNAAKAAAAFATLLLPYSLVGPFAGVFLDRWSRQRILVSSNVVRTALVLVVAALVGAGNQGPAFFVFALAVLSVNRFFLASLSASLPHVVSAGRLVTANSLSTTTGSIATVAGAGLGFGLRFVVGSGNLGSALVMVAASVTYLGSAALATRMDRTLLGPDFDPDQPETREALRRVLSGVADGARHVWHHRAAGHALAAIAAHRFFYGVSTISTILLYRYYFNAGTDTAAGLGGLGLVVAASSLGVVLAAVITPDVARRLTKERWVVCLYLAAATVEVVLGFPYTEISVLGAAFFLGIVAQGSKICVDTIVQESVEDAYRGRVFSFYDILFNVSFVSAAVFAALTLPPNGKSYAVLGVIATGYALTALAYWFATSRHAARQPPPPLPALSPPSA